MLQLNSSLAVQLRWDHKNGILDNGYYELLVVLLSRTSRLTIAQPKEISQPWPAISRIEFNAHYMLILTPCSLSTKSGNGDITRSGACSGLVYIDIYSVFVRPIRLSYCIISGYCTSSSVFVHHDTQVKGCSRCHSSWLVGLFACGL
jgi:hypothetical protein